ncbi:GIY-YIG nuclease family protein [Deinococcus pimensis]|uniref:GIY-YIG nuclease family protein n=1 Tax=Deinococcus pimensis TaxID=309888 RepID=UPI0004B20A3D|nr:GIY-YIG nuclease family protein [Deinococcus pimensis]
MGLDEGYIYVLSNPAFPGVLKIGKTRNDPFDRARQLHSTGVPVPFRVEAAVRVMDMSLVERELHAHFHDTRLSNNREFFRADLKEVLSRLIEYARVSADSPHIEEQPRSAPPESARHPGWYGKAVELRWIHGTHPRRIADELRLDPLVVESCVSNFRPHLVRHPKYGEGIFELSSGEGQARVVRVKFDRYGAVAVNPNEERLTLVTII